VRARKILALSCKHTRWSKNRHLDKVNYRIGFGLITIWSKEDSDRWDEESSPFNSAFKNIINIQFKIILEIYLFYAIISSFLTIYLYTRMHTHACIIIIIFPCELTLQIDVLFKHRYLYKNAVIIKRAFLW